MENFQNIKNFNFIRKNASTQKNEFSSANFSLKTDDIPGAKTKVNNFVIGAKE